MELQSIMFLSSLCRVCLVSDIKMYSIANTNFHKFYEKLTFTQLKTEDKRPETLCYVCFSHLQRFHRFLALSQTTEKLLGEQGKGLMVSQATEVLENRKKLNNFSVISIQSMAVHTYSHNEGDEMKVEKLEINETLENEGSLKDQATVKIEKLEIDDKFENEGISEPVEYKCNKCFKSFPNSSSFTFHMKTHIQLDMIKTKHLTVQKTIRCITDKEAEKDHHINLIKVEKTHIENHHAKHPIKATEKRFSCGFCEKSFILSGHLTEHIRVHTGETPYTCNICNRAFKQKSALNRHKKAHSNEQPFNCTICNSAFKQAASLRRHYNIHSHKVTYICDICAKTFYTKYHIRNHLRCHTGKKLHPCMKCKQSYNNRSALNTHIKSRHTKKEPHYCEECNKPFKHLGNFQRHVKNYHDKE